MSDDKSQPSETPLSERTLANVPGWIRWLFGGISFVLLSICIRLYVLYIRDPGTYASPSDLELSTISIFAFIVLLLCVVPWGSMGLRIRKIGVLEFEQVIQTQAGEHAEEIGDLLLRVEGIEKELRRHDEMAELSENLASQKLRPLLFRFLRENYPKAYSPVRIRSWGGQQKGYESLRNHEQQMIRRILQQMVLNGEAVTRVSQLGNTLYRAPD